jgi:hypothetical protein
MTNFKNYDKEELFRIIDKISIEMSDNFVLTKFYGRVINTTKVSNRYEIFDISKYLKDKIETIEKNFTISKYSLLIKGGRQNLELISDPVKIGDVDFYKSFYILNSTDKSRRLSFNSGLRSETKNFYVVGMNNASLTKKHIKGVTQAAELASSGLNGETFDEQISSIKSLVGNKIKFSKLRDVILEGKSHIDATSVSHRKFDSFKNSIRMSKGSDKISLNPDQLKLLLTPSEEISSINPKIDFYIDAFSAFQIYLTIFNKQDSHVVKNETEKIMKITQWAIRNSTLEMLGI